MTNLMTAEQVVEIFRHIFPDRKEKSSGADIERGGLILIGMDNRNILDCHQFRETFLPGDGHLGEGFDRSFSLNSQFILFPGGSSFPPSPKL